MPDKGASAIPTMGAVRQSSDPNGGALTQLVRYEQARTALAEAHRVDEVKDIRDKAEAMAAYARQAKDQDLILWATEIKVRAERKAGEMLTDMAERGERAVRGDGPRFDPGNSSIKELVLDRPKTLTDLGVTKRESHRWQQLASMSEDHFEAAVATAKDTAGQVTTAFMLREAGRGRPSKRLNGADKERLERLDQSKGTSMLVGYARMVLKAMRERESLSEQEREVLGILREEINSALAH